MVNAWESQVRSIVERVVRQERLQLYWLELRAAGPRWRVCVYIDHPRGISVEDCARVSRALEEPLDQITEHSYEIEVSSPGIDRPLYTREHYESALGRSIELRLRTPHQGRRHLTGYLKELTSQALTVQDADGVLWQIPWEEISRGRLSPCL
ncbi:MAG: ribosome maturation factor RimP [Candidatus Bipolaricaulota bacterium]|nr:ribosome maturation factor RimP [Candidatus Bipolaricaulota bacterium]MCS7273917.1 ribosome maturation factor RimP [Candidatus Bipolaricaulota bacterium]MDW8110796.1 ribosome maturation factor RimP [Candidatus Bipolaricaulota bacterium]MDW8328723.1 ribosome maturation factor RimP [Candidatus Bipolaricaulota bacterium]